MFELTGAREGGNDDSDQFLELIKSYIRIKTTLAEIQFLRIIRQNICHQFHFYSIVFLPNECFPVDHWATPGFFCARDCNGCAPNSLVRFGRDKNASRKIVEPHLMIKSGFYCVFHGWPLK